MSCRSVVRGDMPQAEQQSWTPRHAGTVPTAHRCRLDVDEHLAPAERRGQRLRGHGERLAGLAGGLAAHLQVQSVRAELDCISRMIGVLV